MILGRLSPKLMSDFIIKKLEKVFFKIETFEELTVAGVLFVYLRLT